MRSLKENLHKHSPLVSKYFLGKIIQPFTNGAYAWVDISHKKFDPSKINCKLFFQCEWKINQLRQSIPKGSDRFDRIIEVETFMPHERLIRIWGIGGGEYKGSKAIFDATRYDILPKEKIAPKGAEVVAFVELTKPGLIQFPHRLKHSNGSVENFSNNLSLFNILTYCNNLLISYSFWKVTQNNSKKRRK
ncbi:MAG TPA: hypothetical protein ENI07_05175 [Desulfobacterales bacterium]|nr:hypothetical protein [Desulfobacterales bacterium]